jgi:biotin synthase
MIFIYKTDDKPDIEIGIEINENRLPDILELPDLQDGLSASASSPDILSIIEKVKITHELDKEEIVRLLEATTISDELFTAADEVRKAFVGDEVHLRGLIEFSNICRQNCLYCGLRRDNKNLERYRLEPDTIIDFARKAASYGYKTVVLQSAEDVFYTVEKMQYIIKEIKAMGLAITLSIGEKTEDEYRAYREAGADRYLLLSLIHISEPTRPY